MLTIQVCLLSLVVLQIDMKHFLVETQDKDVEHGKNYNDENYDFTDYQDTNKKSRFLRKGWNRRKSIFLKQR